VRVAVTRSADRVEDTAVADALFAAIGAFRRTTRRVSGRPWPIDELAGAQLELVRVVRRQPGISVTEAAAELALMPNTVSTLVRQLVDRGLIERTADTTDRRIARLSLGADAMRRTEQWRDTRGSITRAAIAKLGSAEREALVEGIAVIGELASAIAAATEEIRA
jgi:DNA-binding MarR family transcriptional regulator